MISALLAAVLLAQNTPAAPPPSSVATAPVAAPKTQVAADDPKKARRDQLLCKYEKVLGSLIARKVCYTREEEELRSQEDRRNTEHLQQSQYMTHQP